MKKCFKFSGLALLCAVLFTYGSVTAQNRLSSGFVINGKIIGVKDSTRVYLVDLDGQKVLDSAFISGGKFIFKGHVNAPTACWIKCLREYATIYVENVVMSFESPIHEMKLNYIAKGGKEQRLNNELDKIQRPYERIYTYAYDSLERKIYRDSLNKVSLIQTFNTGQNTYMNIYVDFGKKHINSYLGLDIVYRNRKKVPKDSVLLLYNSLSEVLKNTDKAKALKTYALEKLAGKGQKFLDFEARTINGEPFKLSELKNKYIYLAFGSFTCGPCRMENKEIAKNYTSLSKVVNIVNFSLDINRQQWEAAAKIDGIVWYNVSDMAGMAGKIKTLYDVQGMPTSFLIDTTGIIVERFDGYDPDNIKKIENIVAGKMSKE